MFDSVQLMPYFASNLLKNVSVAVLLCTLTPGLAYGQAAFDQNSATGETGFGSGQPAAAPKDLDEHRKQKAFGVNTQAKYAPGVDQAAPAPTAEQRTFGFTQGFGYDEESQKIYDKLYSGFGTNHPIEIGDTEPQNLKSTGLVGPDPTQAPKEDATLTKAKNAGYWTSDFDQAGYNLQSMQKMAPAQPAAPAPSAPPPKPVAPAAPSADY